jgi:hypothetical protein
MNLLQTVHHGLTHVNQRTFKTLFTLRMSIINFIKILTVLCSKTGETWRIGRVILLGDKMKISMAFIAGVIMTLLGFQVEKNLIDKKTDDSRAALHVLKENLQKYREVCGHFPSAGNGLDALVTPSLDGCSQPQILQAIPLDPWDEKITFLENDKFIYLIPSQEDGGFAKIAK